MTIKACLLAATAIFATAVAAPALAQDVAAGGADFSARCEACHTGAANAVGPSLAGIVGRKAASANFSYSDGLKASKLTWTPATLNKFLAAPSAVVPGTMMIVSTPDPKQRANLIAYLAKH